MHVIRCSKVELEKSSRSDCPSEITHICLFITTSDPFGMEERKKENRTNERTIFYHRIRARKDSSKCLLMSNRRRVEEIFIISLQLYLPIDEHMAYWHNDDDDFSIERQNECLDWKSSFSLLSLSLSFSIDFWVDLSSSLIIEWISQSSRKRVNEKER